MDKNELKQILHEQFEPLEKAVQKKLDYLQSDSVFALDSGDLETDEKPTTDTSLEDAFSYFAAPKPVSAYEVPKVVDSNVTRDMSNIRERKQNIAARIAAMRGISMPGDYLNHK